jgi:hypothetical protein
VVKLYKLFVVICLWGCIQTHPALACRYNVRETGFVDLGIESYYLFGYVSKDTPAEITSTFEQVSYAALMDSSIRLEIIDANQQKDHPAMKFLDLWSIQSFPAAVLVSPDGQSLPVPVTKPGRPFKQTLWSALDDILSSPKREEIVQQVSKTYGAVLLIEGADAEQNKKAKAAASGAIEKVSMQMEWMPKSIAHPPVLLTIDSESLSREKILLWSLGLDAEKVNEPYAVVLYGRARWIGPLFKGEEITEAYLANVLFVIGADCECGFDYRWLQGTMLPVRWDEKAQARVAESLGFDPENPMVKMEMSRIIGRGFSSYPGVPFGYQEFVVESVNEPEQILPAQVQNTVSPPSAAAESVPEESVLAESKPVLQKPLFFIASLAVLIIAVGLFIVFRSARKNL